MSKKCNGCKRHLEKILFMRKDKEHARCNDCSSKSSCKKNICKVCGIKAYYNYENLSFGVLCSTHKEVGMVNVKKKTCEYDGCKKQPSFNIEGERPRYCTYHKEPGMVNVKDKTCEYDGCKKRPNFNIEGIIEAKYCADHKEPGMVNINTKTCEYDGCKKRPNFNKEGETKGRYCTDHKETGMVNVMSKTCEYDGCKKQPVFNKEGESKVKYCRDHKEPGMVDVKNKNCEYDGCKKQPAFNKEGEGKGRYCIYHKEPDMIDVKHKTCEYEACKIRPTFNTEGETRGRYCIDHKEPGMINVKDKTCEYDGCKKIPFFNKEGETKGRYCTSHKEPDMVDVKSKTCEYDGCKTNCIYGYCNQTPSHCAQHKLDYMITNPKRTCIGNDDEECKESATHGKNEPIHCEEHSLQDEICWLVKPCEKCGRKNELLNREGLCGVCCDIPFYEESKRQHKIKENIMVKYLREYVKEGNEILSDRIIDSTCNLYRPDILYDCGSHIVVVECDEYQHSKYNWESCASNKSLEHMEEKRMYEIMVAYGLPAVFIRWNPDSFKVRGEVCKRYNNKKRLELLVKWVKKLIKPMTTVENVVSYKKLFYDDFKEDDLEFKVIDPNSLL